MKYIQLLLGRAGCLSVNRVGLFGGLALRWQHGMDITIRSSRHVILMPSLEFWSQLHLVYWFLWKPKYDLHKHSWDLLRRIVGDVIGRWLVVGDFNEIVAAHEYLGRLTSNCLNQIELQAKKVN
ncbi:unnamed protein product [Prunus armeniaca]|uniref:Endonuclease/exonuclease/phosphatase domain-containing protein n=1 Tax=Prunus armeniaca TaxID=36596 RepID=A0A6J5TE23_PRUAR|nr:unnamed protein product [Prunus armeniaca]